MRLILTAIILTMFSQQVSAAYMNGDWCADQQDRALGQMVSYLQYKKKSSKHLQVGHDELVETGDKHLERAPHLSNVHMVLYTN